MHATTNPPIPFVRTPDHRFGGLPDWPYEPRYLEFEGLRMHYVDEGAGAETILLLHGEPSWGYLYRDFIRVLAPHYRVIVPDWLGFGRSDKPTRVADYSFEFHLRSLEHFIASLDLKGLTVVVQDWGGLLGLGMVGQRPDWFKRLVIMNTFLPIGEAPSRAFRLWRWLAMNSPVLPIGLIMYVGTARASSKSRAVRRAYQAPFPGRRYKAGARAFPALVPVQAGDPAIPFMQRAREVLGAWQRPCLVMFSDRDPITGPARRFFAELVPTAQEVPGQRIKNAGHFLQEDAGEEIARYILSFVRADAS